MKAKLIKKEKGYTLVSKDGTQPIGSTLSNKEGHKLSLKNCQAIELDYDLDELINEAFDNMGHHSTVTIYEEDQFKLGYKLGFQKALDLMEHRLSKETEWQVEVVMDICGDKVYAVPEPALDEHGCLILKRIDN